MKASTLEHFKYAKSELAQTVVTRLLIDNDCLLKNPDGYGYS